MSIIERISGDLSISVDFLKELEKKNYCYKTIEVKGKRKKRIVHVPCKELKTIQYWLVCNIFEKCKTSEYCSAYKKGMSIRKNALKHANNDYILHMDIKDFFPSIDYKKMLNMLLKNDLDLSIDDLKTICHYSLYRNNNVVIGSICAPSIANAVMYEFDNELHDLLISIGDFVYIRYSDDIIISSKKYIDKKIVEKISQLLNKYGFKVNEKKTYFMSKNMKRNITGVTIDNNNN